MPLEIRAVKNRKELRKFIRLPAEIHKNHPNWVPPVYSEEWKYFSPHKNKAFPYCDTTLALAYRNSEVVGRIMGIIHHRYNTYRNERNGRFAYLECWDDQEVAHELLGHVENWVREKGMNKIVGPMGFSDQNPEADGFQIEGFEHTPTFATYCNLEYIIRLLKNEGYTKEVDYVVYKVPIPKELPDFYKRINQRILRRKEFKLVEFSKRSHLKPYIRPVFNLMNECFKDSYGFLPIAEKEGDDMAKRYLVFFDPRFIKLATRNGEVASFVISIPNLSDGLRKAKGHLLPFGIFKILRAAKKTKQLDLLCGVVKQEYRGRGLDVFMGFRMFEDARDAGFEYMDSHHELETNTRVRAEMEAMNGKVYKRFRIFQKKL